jgi:hypothetical protein
MKEETSGYNFGSHSADTDRPEWQEVMLLAVFEGEIQRDVVADHVEAYADRDDNDRFADMAAALYSTQLAGE